MALQSALVVGLIAGIAVIDMGGHEPDDMRFAAIMWAIAGPPLALVLAAMSAGSRTPRSDRDAVIGVGVMFAGWVANAALLVSSFALLDWLFPP